MHEINKDNAPFYSSFPQSSTPPQQLSYAQGYDQPVAPATVQEERNIRLYVTLKKSADDEGDQNRRLILMTPTNIKISMLKRLVEQEYADLFPNEQTFICAKLQDQYGYSLSNSSFVAELLKNHDRLFALPEGIQDANNAAAMHLTSDPQELLYLLRSIQSNVAAKLTECSYTRIENIEEILAVLVPMGFQASSKPVLHNVAHALRKILETERLFIFENPSNNILFNQFITLINFWVGDLIFQDAVLLSGVIDILDLLIKSAVVCQRIKSPMLINNLMNASKLEMASAQTRSRIIRVISYLSKGEFRDLYNPQPVAKSNTQRIDVREMQAPQYQQQPMGSMQQQRFQSNEFQLPRGNTGQNRPQSMRNGKPEGYAERPQQQQINDRHKPTLRQSGLQVVSQNPYDSASLRQQDLAASRPLYQQEYQPYLSRQTQPLKAQQQSAQYHSGTQQRPVLAQREDDYSDLHMEMMRDYVSLLVPDSTPDMHIFAVQNLEPVIQQVINYIMENRESYLKLLNLLEISLPQDYHAAQQRLLDTLAKNLNTQRAVDGLQHQVVQRILKAFNFQPQTFHTTLFELLQQHLKYGDFQVDVPNVMSLIECPYDNLQMLGMKILTVISDPNKSKYNNYDIQFENYVRQLVEYSFDRERSIEFANLALMTLSNLALKDSLRSHIIYNKGIEMFLAHLRNEHNLDGQRIAAKALLNISISSRENKMKIVGELGEEIKKMHRNQIDSIVHGYLQTLLISKDNARAMY